MENRRITKDTNLQELKKTHYSTRTDCATKKTREWPEVRQPN